MPTPFHSCLSLLLLLLLQFFPLSSTALDDAPAYTATDLILLNCGAAAKEIDTSGRTWEPDGKVAGNVTSPIIISHVQLHQSHDSNPDLDVPYRTMWVFYSPQTYSISVNSTGKKFIRLHFAIHPNSNDDTSKSLFSVTANGYTLLSNFSAFLYSKSLNELSFMKEFLIDVIGNRSIDLKFTPNPNSFAFVNGIQIVSQPDNLYFRNKDIKFVPDRLFTLQTDTALETLYRLNVGGGDVKIQDDSGMFRRWSSDDPYIFGADYGFTPHDESHVINYTDETPPYTAPKIVYRSSRTLGNTSKSLEWSFPVDSGFNYMLRFHFCEFQLEITKQNERVFTINIDNQTAEFEVDILFWSGGNGFPTFRDYTAYLPDDDGRRGKRDMRLSLFPNTDTLPKYSSAMLNALEVFKLSDPKQSLAAANPDVSVINNLPLRPDKKNGVLSRIFAVIGSVIGVLFVISTLCFLIFWRRGLKVRDLITVMSRGLLPPTSSRSSINQTNGSRVSRLIDLCRHFSLEEIKIATGNFDENFVIGRGGFGNVYRGFINEGATTIAVKRLHTSSKQGAQEFLTEIELLSRLRHLHLVSLIGYCDEKREMILVYDYMAHGTLHDHLYNSKNPPLTWKHCLEICLGAAKGLDYLHTGTKNAIIHRDVKSTNILLDEKWVAKVSDFGLSKVFPSDAANTHVSTAVKGSFGYLDPDYYKRRQLTDKSDVYSFGVVLFEVLCGRPAILPCSDSEQPDEQVNLAEWANICYGNGTVDEIVDPKLKDQIPPECLNKFVETAITCLNGSRMQRPAMSDVVRSLELALQLQDKAECGTPEFELIGDKELANTMGEVEMCCIEPQLEVFSDLANPLGR